MNIIDRNLADDHQPKDRDLAIVIKSLIAKYPRPKGVLNTILASNFDRDQIKTTVDRLLRSQQLVEREIGTQTYLYLPEKVNEQHRPIAKKRSTQEKPAHLKTTRDRGDCRETTTQITDRLDGLKSYRQNLIDRMSRTIARYQSEGRSIEDIAAYRDRMLLDLGGIDAAIESSTAKLQRLEVGQ